MDESDRSQRSQSGDSDVSSSKAAVVAFATLKPGAKPGNSGNITALMSAVEADASVALVVNPSDAKCSRKRSSEKCSNTVKPDKSKSGDASELKGKRKESSASLDSNASSGTSSSNGETTKTSKKPKKDRSKLRKGKWTVEEEEYTSRIIHYFSTGLLTLPEGATLRSYLADKLNCDPMRITKKYAGASCLGRRVYHFRDRAHPTIAEIQVAKAELDHLEQRFRIRIEGGQAPLATQLSASNSFPVSLPQQSSSSATISNPLQAQNALQTLLLGLTGTQQVKTAESGTPVAQLPATVAPSSAPVFSVPSVAPTTSSQTTAASAAPSPSAATATIAPLLAQLLLNAPGLNIPTQPPPFNPQAQGVDPNLTKWAFAQAAASLGPALSQLAAANIQQAQKQAQQQMQLQQQAQQQAQLQQQQQIQQQAKLQEAQQEKQRSDLQGYLQAQQTRIQQQLQQLKSQQQKAEAAKAPVIEVTAPTPAPPRQPTTKEDQNKMFARELKAAYERHLQSLGLQLPKKIREDGNSSGSKSPVPSTVQPTPTSPQPPSSGRIGQVALLDPAARSSKGRTKEDEDAGTALFGLMSSLRSHYEDALQEEKPLSHVHNKLSAANIKMVPGNGDASDGAIHNRGPNTVTDSHDSSSQQLESSVEDSDWNSDKKTDPSSSEDSDKEERGSSNSKGPPRKRHKSMRLHDDIRPSNKT